MALIFLLAAVPIFDSSATSQFFCHARLCGCVAFANSFCFGSTEKFLAKQNVFAKRVEPFVVNVESKVFLFQRIYLNKKRASNLLQSNQQLKFSVAAVRHSIFEFPDQAHS